LTKKSRKSIFYGISEVVNGRKSEKDWISLIQKIPDNRILAESDLGDPILSGIALERAYSMISKAKGWTAEETKIKVQENFDEFISN
jgi:Tat protein secretion system quality control protein TatD with DNase activity